MFDKESGLLQGTVELLVLKTLSWGPMHGYGIASWIESVTADALSVEEGHDIAVRARQRVLQRHRVLNLMTHVDPWHRPDLDHEVPAPVQPARP